MRLVRETRGAASHSDALIRINCSAAIDPSVRTRHARSKLEESLDR